MLGLLGAGLVMPAVGATGRARRTGVDIFNELPSEFTAARWPSSRASSTPTGTSSRRRYDENRIIVPLTKVAPIMREAQIAIEDRRFYEHGGVDMQGVVRAADLQRSQRRRHLRARRR